MPKLTPVRTPTAITFLTAALACGLAASAQAQDRPTVVVVNYALSYFAERLLQEDAEVVFPVPEGADPAFWQPNIAAISTMQQSDLILLNGAGFATWTTKASLPRSKIVNTSRNFEDQYISTETITHSHGADGEHSHTGTATYTWLDPDLAIQQAQAIAAAAIKRGLADEDTVRARLSALAADLDALDAAASDLAALAAGLHIVATHPRYQYLARAYDLQISSLEWEPGASPDADQRAELAALKAATGATVLLWEAEPPGAAREAVRALGMADTVFPTLATNPQGADYLETFGAAVEDLKSALKLAEG